MRNRVAVNLDDETVRLLDRCAEGQRESRAAAGGELLAVVLRVDGDVARECLRLQNEVDRLQQESAARSEEGVSQELAVLRADRDRLLELVQECRHRAGLYEGLLHAEKQEKMIILEKIPKLPPVSVDKWERIKRMLRFGRD